MADDNSSATPRHLLARFWGTGVAVFGGLAGIAKFTIDLPKTPPLQHRDSWVGDFIPDVGIACLEQPAILAILDLPGQESPNSLLRR